MRNSLKYLLPVTVAALMLTAGCSGSDNGKPAAPRASSGPAAATSPTRGTGAATPSRPSATLPKPVCGDTTRWGTDPSLVPTTQRVTERISGFAVGSHERCDRLRFDLTGNQDFGFYVQYVKQVTSDPAGQPVPVAGGAVLEITIMTLPQGWPSADSPSGHQMWRVGQALMSGHNRPAVGELKFAGASDFEGTQKTIFALGINAPSGQRRPFRVFVAPNGPRYSLVIDVAYY